MESCGDSRVPSNMCVGSRVVTVEFPVTCVGSRVVTSRVPSNM